jgi:hypothetical protein
MLLLFFLMIVLNAFLLYTWLKKLAAAKPAGTRKADIPVALHLVFCITALLLRLLNYDMYALLLMTLPVSVAGLLEVILPLFAGIFKLRYSGTIFFNRNRKIIFD